MFKTSGFLTQLNSNSNVFDSVVQLHQSRLMTLPKNYPCLNMYVCEWVQVCIQCNTMVIWLTRCFNFNLERIESNEKNRGKKCFNINTRRRLVLLSGLIAYNVVQLVLFLLILQSIRINLIWKIEQQTEIAENNGKVSLASSDFSV